MAFSGRMREMMKKYGKVALGVHLSVSATSITGLYIAIKNNVDVQSLFEKIGLSSTTPHHEASSGETAGSMEDPSAVILEDHEFSLPAATNQEAQRSQHGNRTAELAASSGGALALAILCNKALFPIRVPITIALTPPIARFLARRNFIKNV